MLLPICIYRSDSLKSNFEGNILSCLEESFNKVVNLVVPFQGFRRRLVPLLLLWAKTQSINIPETVSSEFFLLKKQA